MVALAVFAGLPNQLSRLSAAGPRIVAFRRGKGRAVRSVRSQSNSSGGVRRWSSARIQGSGSRIPALGPDLERAKFSASWYPRDLSSQ